MLKIHNPATGALVAELPADDAAAIAAKAAAARAAQPAWAAQALAEGLARFRPTVVAVERDADAAPDRAVKSYADYLAGQGRDDRNEIVQVGFRLARLAGLQRVVGIDTHGDFPFEALQAWAQRNGRAADLQKEIEDIQARVKRMEQQQKTHTIGQVLRVKHREQHVLAPQVKCGTY